MVAGHKRTRTPSTHNKQVSAEAHRLRQSPPIPEIHHQTISIMHIRHTICVCMSPYSGNLLLWRPGYTAIIPHHLPYVHLTVPSQNPTSVATISHQAPAMHKPDWHRNPLHNVLAHHVHIVLQLRRDGHYGRPVCNGALDELLDGLGLVDSHSLGDEVNLVLKNDNVLYEALELHGLGW